MLVVSAGTSKRGTAVGIAVEMGDAPEASTPLLMPSVGSICGRLVGVVVGTAVLVGSGVAVGVWLAVGLGPGVGE